MSVALPKPSNTRLVTIVAHVDHGKTTLADSLCEHNGIISERLAGTIRYLDSMEEEQRRGITIRSSAIGIKHSYRPIKRGNNSKEGINKIDQDTSMVIHLIDSPGHVDFSWEVSSALQICDGAILIVDVVEGMCARSHSILREAYSQKLVPILVLNKIDRLCTDLGLTVDEAYVRIRSVIENVNAAASALIRSSRAQNDEEKFVDDEEIELIWTFDPSMGNVVFTSALYGWGFTIPSLARSLFKAQVIPNIKPPVIRQYLFGDFKYRADTGKILKWKQQAADSSERTMFAEFGLQPLWNIMTGVSIAANSIGIESQIFGGSNQHQTIKYHATNTEKIKATDQGMNDLVLGALKIGGTVSQDAAATLQTPTSMEQMQDILNKSNASSEESILRSILRRHRPLSDAVLDAVCDFCPSPSDASSHFRKSALSLTNQADSLVGEDLKEYHKIESSVNDCKSKDDPSVVTVAHCCKFISSDRGHINDTELFADLDDSEECKDYTGIILGIARVLSGSLRSNDVEYYCFGPKYKGLKEDSLPPRKKIRLYLVMGSRFIRVNEVPAGHICAVHGLEELQMKSVTLCSSRLGMPINSFYQGLRPLVKVNLEAADAADTRALERGLAKLSLADAAVEVTATAKGEMLLACLGEIHLEQSILDLKNNYIGKEIELRVSQPIVNFGESTTWFENEENGFQHFFNLESPPLRQTLIPPYCYEDGITFARNGRCRAVVSDRTVAVHVRVLPLSRSVFESLNSSTSTENGHDELLKLGSALGFKMDEPELIISELRRLLVSFDKKGNALIESARVVDGTSIVGVMSDNNEIYCPQLSDKNVEQNKDSETNQDDINTRAKRGFEDLKVIIANNKEMTTPPSDSNMSARLIWKSDLRGSISGGFQSACAAGPLCEEPLRGVIVVIEGVEIAVKPDLKAVCSASGGMIVAALRTGIRSALLSRPVRLMEGTLKLTLHSSLTGLGPLYAILSKRRGRVLSDTMVDGTDLIAIEAVIPQIESFGLTPELMQKSSGEVTAPELIFSHWEILDEDPFWIPTSLEEREDHGEMLTGAANNAIKYIRMIRDRKGLIVDSKILVAAEKQRTLARKK